MKARPHTLSLVLAIVVPYALAAKPVRQLVITADQLAVDLKLLLGDLWVQIDQSNDASHAQTIASTYTVCVPATVGEKSQCKENCRLRAGDDINLMKACIAGCDTNQDCHQECGNHQTANFVRFGGAFNQLLTKTCNAPSDSCPRCTPNSNTPLVDDQDITYVVPNPVVPNKDIGIGTISCKLTRFSVKLPISGNPDYDALVTTDLSPEKGLHIRVKAAADSPSLRCSGAVPLEATLQNPTVDFYLRPTVVNHKASWAASAYFSAHVLWALQAFSLDGVVADNVNAVLAGYLAASQAKINAGMTGWIVGQIATQKGDKVDDIVSITTSTTQIVVSYTPQCDGTTCGCGQSCGWFHACDAQYWNASAPAPTCPRGQVCLGTGDCCQPKCGPGSCGDDGCGRSCGGCVKCDEGPCTGACHKTACGTWCGTCKPSYYCDTGGCKDSRGRRGLEFHGLL